MLLKKRIGKIHYIQAFVDETLKRPRLFTMARLKNVDWFPAKYPGVDHLVDSAQGQHQHTCQTELQLVPELLFLVSLFRRCAFPHKLLLPAQFYPACWSP